MYSEAKNQHFRLTGATRCTDWCEILHRLESVIRWHIGPFCHVKFNANRCTGVRTRPQKFENFYFFGTESPHTGEPFDRFGQLLGIFMRPHLVFYIWRNSLHRLRSYCWESARRSSTQNFSVHLVWKTMRYIEKWHSLFSDTHLLSGSLESSQFRV